MAMTGQLAGKAHEIVGRKRGYKSTKGNQKPICNTYHQHFEAMESLRKQRDGEDTPARYYTGQRRHVATT